VISPLLCLFREKAGKEIRDNNICVSAVHLFLLPACRGMEYIVQKHSVCAYVFRGCGQSSKFLRLKTGTQTEGNNPF